MMPDINLREKIKCACAYLKRLPSFLSYSLICIYTNIHADRDTDRQGQTCSIKTLI